MTLESKTFGYHADLVWQGGRLARATAGDRPPVLIGPPRDVPGGDAGHWSPEQRFPHNMWEPPANAPKRGERAMSVRPTRYRLRNPSRHEDVYGDQVADERSAFARARKLADFYQVPIEVCQVSRDG